MSDGPDDDDIDFALEAQEEHEQQEEAFAAEAAAASTAALPVSDALAELERRGAAPSASSSRPPPTMGAPATSEHACESCRTAAAAPKFFEAFGVKACFDCQRADKAEGGRYQLITKTKARDEYLLTEAQCGALGCIKKPNPHDARYGEMRLYLRAQVAAAALASWGSEEGLLVERERRREERLQRSKRKAAAGGGAAGARHIKRGGRAPEVAPEARAAAAAAAAKALARRAPPPHEHAFLPDETYNADTDEWTKRCACGFEVVYERC